MIAARRRLIENGFPEERLRRFPADQVLLLDEKRECDVRTDELMKTMTLPLWQGEALTAALKSNQGPTLFCDAVVPMTSTARRVQGKLDQRIGLLRHVEALRLHAAEHGGTLPANLTDVSVPLPVDPFTGKPFRYEVQDNMAHLRGTPPPGEETNFGFNVHYEVTVAEATRLRPPKESSAMTHLLVATVALVAFPNYLGAGETTVRLEVEPMSESKPAFKYQLLPELRELNPGNAAQDYVKCFMEQRAFFFGKEATADRARYQTMPLAELAGVKLPGYGGFALRQADWAARLDTVDWQALERIQNGGIERLPAELGPIQVLARALHVRFRGEVACRQYPDAIRTAKTILALGRHLGEHPTELASLVGLWVAHLGVGTLTEMVQQPRCPNLYWALTDLPCPLVDLRKGVQGDRTQVAAKLRLLRDDAAMTETEIETFVSHLSGLINFAREQAGHAPRNLRAELAIRVKDPECQSAARQRLIDAGSAPYFVLKIPPMQVALLDEKLAYEIHRDEHLKHLALPLWQLGSSSGNAAPSTDRDTLFTDLLPPIIKLRRTQGALEQEIALLRHRRGPLRLHAAEHSGTLPATLSEISVPLPGDPFTGKPFVYTVEGATAHLRGDSYRGDEQHPESSVHYEVSLRK